MVSAMPKEQDADDNPLQQALEAPSEENTKTSAKTSAVSNQTNHSSSNTTNNRSTSSKRQSQSQSQSLPSRIKAMLEGSRTAAFQPLRRVADYGNQVRSASGANARELRRSNNNSNSNSNAAIATEQNGVGSMYFKRRIKSEILPQTITAALLSDGDIAAVIAAEEEEVGVGGTSMLLDEDESQPGNRLRNRVQPAIPIPLSPALATPALKQSKQVSSSSIQTSKGRFPRRHSASTLGVGGDLATSSKSSSRSKISGKPIADNPGTSTSSSSIKKVSRQKTPPQGSSTTNSATRSTVDSSNDTKTNGTAPTSSRSLSRHKTPPPSSGIGMTGTPRSKEREPKTPISNLSITSASITDVAAAGIAPPNLAGISSSTGTGAGSTTPQTPVKYVIENGKLKKTLSIGRGRPVLTTTPSVVSSRTSASSTTTASNTGQKKSPAVAPNAKVSEGLASAPAPKPQRQQQQQPNSPRRDVKSMSPQRSYQTTAPGTTNTSSAGMRLNKLSNAIASMSHRKLKRQFSDSTPRSNGAATYSQYKQSMNASYSQIQFPSQLSSKLISSTNVFVPPLALSSATALLTSAGKQGEASGNKGGVATFATAAGVSTATSALDHMAIKDEVTFDQDPKVAGDEEEAPRPAVDRRTGSGVNDFSGDAGTAASATTHVADGMMATVSTTTTLKSASSARATTSVGRTTSSSSAQGVLTPATTTERDKRDAPTDTQTDPSEPALQVTRESTPMSSKLGVVSDSSIPAAPSNSKATPETATPTPRTSSSTAHAAEEYVFKIENGQLIKVPATTRDSQGTHNGKLKHSSTSLPIDIAKNEPLMASPRSSKARILSMGPRSSSMPSVITPSGTTSRNKKESASGASMGLKSQSYHQEPQLLITMDDNIIDSEDEEDVDALKARRKGYRIHDPDFDHVSVASVQSEQTTKVTNVSSSKNRNATLAYGSSVHPPAPKEIATTTTATATDGATAGSGNETGRSTSPFPGGGVGSSSSSGGGGGGHVGRKRTEKKRKKKESNASSASSTSTAVQSGTKTTATPTATTTTVPLSTAGASIDQTSPPHAPA